MGDDRTMMGPVLMLGNGINLATATPDWRSLVFNLSLLIEEEEVRTELSQVAYALQ